MMKFTTLTFAPILVCLLSGLACAHRAQDSSHGADQPSPVGTVWRWTSLAGSESLEVAHPGRYTLELLADGQFAVRADCNVGGGSYTLDGDRLSLGPSRMTMAACAPDSLGDRFAGLLGSVAGFSRNDDRLVLELAEGAGTMQFEAMKQIALAGTSWLVRSYNNGKQAVVSVAAGTALHATFADDGTVAGSAGCNHYTASYEADGQRITIGPAAATRKMCFGEGVMEQESAFLAALSTAATWKIRGERLQVRTADGALALDLVAAVTGTEASRRDPGSEGVFRGHLVWGHEARSFTECGSGREGWVVDETGGDLAEVHAELTTEPYQSLFVEVLGRWEAAPSEGFRADYAEQLVITELRRAALEGCALAGWE